MGFPSVLTSFVVFMVMICVSQQFWSNNECSKWIKPDYSKCRIGISCDPMKANPCGCPHSCCAWRSTPWWKGKVIPVHGRKRRDLATFDKTASDDLEGSYWCYKKGECRDRCGSILGESHVGKCGCGKGLKCRTGGSWFQVIKRCWPSN